MKKIFLVALILFVGLASVQVFAEDKDENKSDVSANSKGKIKPAKSADEVIAKITGRMDKRLEKMRQRFDRFSERLEKIEKRGERPQRKAGKRLGEGVRGLNASGSESMINTDEFKTRLTERYEKFKGIIAERKKKMEERFAKNETREGKLSKFSPEDQAKIKAAIEEKAKTMKTEIAKLLDDASAKLDAAYQSALSKLK
ncbi:MAG: hypothetical protein HQM10_25445 [Candidatus Riflebacteria bacterium]|nr:hypothetical protein [Candidatus Riflebacteria bacterium]